MTFDDHHAIAFIGRLARARNASADGHWEAAIPLWEAVIADNPTEADFWTRLAEARFHSEQLTAARDAYAHAFELGAGFPFDTAYAMASCYALEGDAEHALSWLERAFALGYRDLAGAQTDSSFAALRDNARYRELVALVDVETMTRDEGWRYDLALLSREVKRKAHHPFRRLSESDFDTAVRALDEDIPGLSDVEVLVGMQRILALLRDGHAGVYVTRRPARSWETLPLAFYLFEDGLFIVATAPEQAELLGCQVLRYGDHEIETIFEAITPITTRDNDHWLKQVVPYTMRELPVVHALGLIPEPHEVPLNLRRLDGSEDSVSVAVAEHPTGDQLWEARPCPPGWRYFPETLTTPLPSYLRHQSLAYWFEHLPGEQAVYFQFNMVRDDPAEDLEAFTARLFDVIEDQSVNKLVIDLRWNNGGNTFLEMPLLHRIIGSRVNRPGRLFVIIGRRTFSAAQNFASMLERHTEAIFVGEPTGASPNFVGENINIELPYSKLGMNVSDLYWQSSWPTDYRTWIAPLLYLPPTFAAFRENRDPALQAIMSLSEHLPGW